MTVSSQQSEVPYTGDGVTRVFPVPFYFLQNSDIQIVINDVFGNIYPAVQNVDYTVTGAGNEAGGTVTFGVAPLNLLTITIQRIVPATQLTDYQPNDDFPAETHERALDKLTMLVQQSFAGLSRALTRPLGKPYYDAQGRNIKFLAEPIDVQDATTKNWVSTYFAALLDATTGPTNTTTGILYDATTLFDYLRFGVGRTVDSIAALRLLSGSRNQRAFAVGYYAKGDGGGGAYYIDPTDTTSADNGGTIIVAADGFRWKLAQQGRISVKQFGARGDGTSDDSAAITRAHTAIPALYYPASTYRCASKITLVGQVIMLGDAPGASKLFFNGATQGVDITQQTADQIFDISKLSFVTNDSTNSFIGLRINGIPQITTNTDGLRFFLGDRNKARGKVSDIVFTGQTNASGWRVGLNMEAMMNYEVSNLTYTGVVPAVIGNLTGCGILINGDGGGTDIRFSKIWIYYALYSVLAPDYIEGLHIYDYEFVVVTYGIYIKYVPAFSKLPAASSGLLSMYADQGHINCLQGGFIIEKSNGNFIKTQNIYLQPRAADAGAYGISLNGGNDHRIRDIFVGGDQAANTKINNYGVVLQGVGLSSVDNVTGTSIQAPVSLVGSSFNDIMNLQSRACANGCVADSGSSQNSIGPTRASGLIGAKYNVSLDNNIRMDEYAGFASRTLSAGATANISIALPLGTFSEAPRFATLTIDSSSIYYKWQYLRTSSSTTQVTFLLAPASPATTIPAETIEVCVNARGI